MLIWALALALVGCPAAAAAQGEGKAAAKTKAKVKDGIERVCCGPRARVKLLVRGVGKVEGFVESAGAESFVVVRTDKGHVSHSLAVAYSEVTRIRGKEVSVNWQKVGAGGLLGARALLGVLRSSGGLRLPPQPARR